MGLLGMISQLTFYQYFVPTGQPNGTLLMISLIIFYQYFVPDGTVRLRG